MGTKQFVKELLHTWCEHEIEAIRPEFYAMGEPVRCSISDNGVDAAVSEWLTNKMPVLLRRESSPEFSVDLDWREDRGRDPRLFPWECRVDLDFRAGDDLAIEMFRFIVAHLEPAFASLSNEDDLKAKHYLEYVDEDETITQWHVGREPGGKTFPSDVSATLPGVYWVTFFSSWAAKRIGREKLESVDAFGMEEFAGGYLLRAYEDSKLIQSKQGLQVEDDIREHLGRGLFFDKSLLTEEQMRSLASA